MAPLLPVYYQIKETIKSWIINKEFRPGEMIPSENALASRFGVNRLTVRQATSRLAQEGLLVSRRGQGTFVTPNTVLIENHNMGFIRFMDRFFYQISKSIVRTAKTRRMKAPKLVREKLGLKNEEAEVIQIKRTQFVDRRAYAYHVNYFPLQLGAKIMASELGRKFILQIIEEDLGISFTETFQTVQASFADQEISKQLKIATGSPILFMESIMYTRRKRPVYFVQSSYRADLYMYAARFTKSKRGNKAIWYIREE